MIKHLKKYFLFHRDVVIATLFTYVLILLLALVFYNTKFLNPIYSALKDFEFTDVYYSSYVKKNMRPSDDIVLVNIGSADRETIGKKLEIIKKSNPRAIGLDLWFPEMKEPYGDSILKAALTGNLPIILGTRLHTNSKIDSSIKLNESSHPYFLSDNTNEGFTNFLAEENETVRYYTPYFIQNNIEYNSLTAEILKESNNSGYEFLRSRNKKSEIINYSTCKFQILEIHDLEEGASELEILQGKLVLIGFMGFEPGFMGFGNRIKTMDDLHLTPLNKSYGGHAIPDMYGLEIHAHILQMLIDRNYINELPSTASLVIGLILTLLHMYAFVFFFVREHIWFHIAAKTFQVVSFGVLFFAAIVLYHYSGLKIEPSFLLLAVVLSVDSLYFLDGLLKFLHKKFGLQTYFVFDHH